MTPTGTGHPQRQDVLLGHICSLRLPSLLIPLDTPHPHWELASLKLIFYFTTESPSRNVPGNWSLCEYPSLRTSVQTARHAEPSGEAGWPAVQGSSTTTSAGDHLHVLKVLQI